MSHASHFSVQRYSNIEFLVSLFLPMIRHDPQARPDAREVLEHWLTLRSTIPALKRRWRMRPRVEPGPETVAYEAYTLIRALLHFRYYVVATCACIVAFRYGTSALR